MKPLWRIFSLFRQIAEEFRFYLLVFLHEKMTPETLPVGHSASISFFMIRVGLSFHCDRRKEEENQLSLVFALCLRKTEKPPERIKAVENSPKGAGRQQARDRGGC